MSITDTGQDQMFPVLEPAVVERLRQFGEIRPCRPGETTGDHQPPETSRKEIFAVGDVRSGSRFTSDEQKRIAADTIADVNASEPCLAR